MCSFRPELEGGYTVRCAAFPEIVTYGASPAEARAAAREAIELCVEVYQQEGRNLPPPDKAPHKTIKEMVPVKLASGVTRLPTPGTVRAILKQARLSRTEFLRCASHALQRWPRRRRGTTPSPA
jgi:predicted RNase H-like HicB family nuclease